MSVTAYTLELLHISNQETSFVSFNNTLRASAVVNALKAQDLFNDGLADNTLFLSSGSAYIAGSFLEASTPVFQPFNDGARGIADILIQNELGVQAISFGNHEFDLGPTLVRNLILGDTSPNATGTNFPYLSCNLDFSLERNLNFLQVPPFGAPLPRSIASSVAFTVGNQTIGVVGATTPFVQVISSPGPNVLPSPELFGVIPSESELDELAGIIQTEVDGLIAANNGMNKVILLSHMVDLSIEFALASRLKNVDIIVAGGSKTRLFDANDHVRNGDSVQGTYPMYIQDADNKTTAVVNTDGNYKYIGRLVIGFDSMGNLIPTTYNESVSGAYATDAQGIALINSTGTATINSNIQRISTLLEDTYRNTEGDVLGLTNVYLNGIRGSYSEDPIQIDGVRTQETNLGDLTTDANLYYARLTDPTVTVSIKNGGGIRGSIGQIIVQPNSTTELRLPPKESQASDGTIIKPTGGISQLDIKSTLFFNNNLTIETVTKAELKSIMEHGLAFLLIESGRMCQVAGLSITFNSSLPAFERIIAMDITSVTPSKQIVSNGFIVGDENETFRVVTLQFLSDGGDKYPFPQRNRSMLSIDEGTSSFAAPGSERDAFAEYLLKFFKTTPYNQEDTDRTKDQRLIDLAFVGAPVPVPVAAPIPIPAQSPLLAPVPNTVPIPVPVQISAPVLAAPVPVQLPAPAPSAPVLVPLHAPVPIPVFVQVPAPVPAAPVQIPGPVPVAPVPVQLPAPMAAAPVPVQLLVPFPALPVLPAPQPIPLSGPLPVTQTAPVAAPVSVPVRAPFAPPVPASRPSNGPFRANTRAPSSNPPTSTGTPTAAPQRSNCGLFGLDIFCPFTFCGFVGRLFGFCSN